jgi:Integrase core domain
MPSMGSTGDAYDNAMAESFFATLECELLDRSTFRNRTEARLAVFDYIEGFYNTHRRHSSIGQLAPAEFERRLRAGTTPHAPGYPTVHPGRDRGSQRLSGARFDGHRPDVGSIDVTRDVEAPRMGEEVDA